MKKITSFMFMVTLIVPILTANATIPLVPPRPGVPGRLLEASPCASKKIVIDGRFVRGAVSLEKIKSAFRNYNTPECFSPINNQYELLFEFNGVLPISEPLIFNALNARNVLISGLRLQKVPDFPTDMPLIEIINNTAPTVNIADTILTGVTNGLELAGTRNIILSNSDISGDGAGICLGLVGSNHTVKSSNFHGCDKGVQIDGDYNFLGAVSAETFNTEKNEIHDNKTGIYWASGFGNRFGYNKISNNNRIVGIYTPNDAISIDDSVGVAMRERERERELLRPAFAYIEGSPPIRCEKDPSGRVISRWIQFNSETVSNGQEVLIYQADRMGQVYEYLTKCTIIDDGQCQIVLPARVPVGENQCGVNISGGVIALINSPIYTSMFTLRRLSFDIPVVALGADTPIDIFSPPAGVGGEIAPPSDASDVDRNDISQGSEMAGPISVGNIDSVQLGSGGGTGAALMPGKGCTLVDGFSTGSKSMASGILLWWLIFATPVVLVLMRIRKK